MKMEGCCALKYSNCPFQNALLLFQKALLFSKSSNAFWCFCRFQHPMGRELPNNYPVVFILLSKKEFLNVIKLRNDLGHQYLSFIKQYFNILRVQDVFFSINVHACFLKCQISVPLWGKKIKFLLRYAEMSVPVPKQRPSLVFALLQSVSKRQSYTH